METGGYSQTFWRQHLKALEAGCCQEMEWDLLAPLLSGHGPFCTPAKGCFMCIEVVATDI